MTRCLIRIIFFCLCIQPLYADIFYYEDSEGVIHFSDEASAPKAKRFQPTRQSYIGNASVNKPELRRLILELSEELGVDPSLVEAIVKAESEYDPEAVSIKGARGLMQLMPETAEGLGVNDIHDPHQNLRGGIRHLKALLDKYNGNIEMSAAAYNAGEGAIQRYNGIPPYPETVDYVQKVRKYYNRFSERASRSAQHDATDASPDSRTLAP